MMPSNVSFLAKLLFASAFIFSTFRIFMYTANTRRENEECAPSIQYRTVDRGSNQGKQHNYQKHPDKSKILLLTYARSGSSFTGDVLSAASNALYAFEPLLLLHRTVDLPPWMESGWQNVRNMVEGILSCTPEVYDSVQYNNSPFRILRKGNKQTCEANNPRIVKTIRLRKWQVEPWINQTDIKIVHLVRDPRALYSSMKREQDTWRGDANIQTICMHLRDDLGLEDIMPKDRYLRIRYEDMVEDPDKMLEAIYKFMKVPYDDEIQSYVYSHTHTDPSKRKGLKYYSTFRDKKSFRYDTWKNYLTPVMIEKAETNCADVMKTLGYDKFDGVVPKLIKS